MSALESVESRGVRRMKLAEIDAVVSARLGPARIRGNAQPAVFARQMAMYLASQIGGWSTTQIGKFYNGRDHSTVCYAIQRIKTLRGKNPDVDGLAEALAEEIRRSQPIQRDRNIRFIAIHENQDSGPPIREEMLDSLAERVAARLLARLEARTTIGEVAEAQPSPAIPATSRI